MRAVVVNEAGGPEVLKIEERPIPKATADQTVMKINAFPVHRYEVLTREGGSPSVKFPRVIGIEAVGEVYEPAENSQRQKGQRVITFLGGFGREFDGGYQEYALVPDDQLYTVDFDGTDVELASYPETYYTAFGAFKTAKLSAGQSLLVRGGSTAIGIAAVEFAKAAGISADSTTREADRAQMLRDYGTDNVIMDTDGVLQTDKKYDGVIDLVGAPMVEDSLSHVAPGGYYVLVGMVTGQWLWKDFDPFMNLDQRYATIYDSSRITTEAVNEMFGIIKQNQLKVPISKVFKLDDIQEAHRYLMAKDRPMGQVIISNE